MLYKKLLSLGVAVAFTVSSLTTTAFAENLGKNINKELNASNKKQISIRINEKKDKDNKDSNKNASTTKLKAIQSIIEMMGLKNEALKIKTAHPSYTGKKMITGHGYIYLAIEKKILLEEDLVDFNPVTPAKRHEVAKYLIRAIGMEIQAKENMNAVLDFKDASEVPAASKGYVYLANKLGLITANKGSFQPLKPVTNGEMEAAVKKAKEVEVPDVVDNNTAVSTFVSLNNAKNKISVKLANGTTSEYSLNPLAPVYVNNAYLTVDALKAGDNIKLIFSKSEQIIFIEVVSQAAPDVKLTAVTVEYANLPDILKTQMDTLKLTSNYKAFKYGNHIYLVAARGQQSTGGYGVNIKDAFKVSLGSNKYDIKAIVELTNPAADAVTTQAVSHPYHIVKLDYFEGIQNIKYVDVNNASIAATTLSILDVVETISGTVSFVDAANKKVKVTTTNNITSEYTIPNEAVVKVNNADSQLAVIKVNMSIVITKSNNIITAVAANDTITETTGTLLAISNINGKILTVKVGNEYINYLVNEATVFIVNGQNVTIDQISLNSNIMLKQINGILMEVKVL